MTSTTLPIRISGMSMSQKWVGSVGGCISMLKKAGNPTKLQGVKVMRIDAWN